MLQMLKYTPPLLTLGCSPLVLDCLGLLFLLGAILLR